jgi:ATP-dependent helicase/nuclease subunit B
MILSKENIKEINIDDLIQQYLENGYIEKILFVVPTNRKARTLKKDLFNYAKNKSAERIKIETLETLSEKLLSVSKIFHSISEAASIIFLKQALSKVKLEYYSNYREEIPAGTLEKIRNLILELKRNCVTPEELRNDDEIIELAEKRKASDISKIYKEYKFICKNLNAFDLGDVYEELLNLSDKIFNDNFHELYFDVDFILIDGFNDFTNPEVQIINKLSNNKSIYVSFDYDYKNDKIFSHIRKTFDKLKDFGFKEIIDKRTYPLDRFTTTVREKLFVFQNAKQLNFTDKIFEMYGNKKEDEIELIASEIKRLIIEDNVKPSNICVVFNQVQEYSEIVKDTFEKYGLPFNLTDRQSLDTSQPIISIINFLEVVETDFYYKSLFRALNSSFIYLPNIDIDNLQFIASEFKIISGKNNWNEILSINNRDDFDESNLSLEQIQKAQKDFEKVSNLLSPFEVDNSIDEFYDKLINLILELKIPFNILSNWNEQEANSRALTIFLDTVQEVFSLIKNEESEPQKHSTAYFLKLIRTICNWARFNVKEKSNYGVLVTSIEEIRGLKFDYIFISGLIEGILPTKYSPQIFRSSSFKKKAIEHYSKERFLFYKALTSFNKKLYLSYHLITNKSELIRSNFLDDFDQLFFSSKIIKSNFSNFIFTEEQAQINYNFINDEKINFDKEKINKSININNTRKYSPFDKSVYNGYLLSDDSLSTEDLKKYFINFKEKQFSITQLEQYALCPFKYFIETILSIKKIEEPSEDIEPIELGRILHKILFEFYTTIRINGITIQNCDDDTFEKSKEIMIQIATQNVEKSIFKSPINFYEKEKILGIDGNFEQSILFQFLKIERESKDFIPQFFEVAFGKIKKDGSDESLFSEQPINIDGIKLRGKIDRIEINEEAKSFNVVDYKLSGKKPTQNDIAEGISLQLPFYLYATKELLSRTFNENFSPNEMIIYSLKFKTDKFGKMKVALPKGKNINDVIRDSINYIKNYIESISNAEFHLSKLKNREKVACKNCNYFLICRVDELIKEYNEEESNE